MSPSETATTAAPAAAPEKARRRRRPVPPSSEANGNGERRVARKRKAPGGDGEDVAKKVRRRPASASSAPEARGDGPKPSSGKARRAPLPGQSPNGDRPRRKRPARPADGVAPEGEALSAPVPPRRRKRRRKVRKKASPLASWLRRAQIPMKSLRLLIFLIGAGLVLVAAAAWGYFNSRSKEVNRSELYQQALEYDARFEREKNQYIPPVDPLLVVPNSTLLMNEAHPTRRFIRQQISYISPYRPSHAADILMGKWRGAGLEAKQTASPAGEGKLQRYSLTATSPTDEHFAVMATIAPEDELGETCKVSITMGRTATEQEKQWLRYPDALPEGPPGSRLRIKGGAMGFSNLGRVYSWTIPLDVNETRRFFIHAMLTKNWLVQPTMPADKDAAFSYLCRRGAESYTLMIAPLKGADDRESIALFMPF